MGKDTHIVFTETNHRKLANLFPKHMGFDTNML